MLDILKGCRPQRVDSKGDLLQDHVVRSLCCVGADCLDDGEEISSPRPKDVLAVEVWELQRRSTLFHDDWHAPFLPHDGEKQWRWVDGTYSCHQWISDKGYEHAAASDEPPLEPPEPGWKQSGSWRIVEPPGPCDPDGWQYAMDFHPFDNWWGDDPSMRHCRRRLWRSHYRYSPARRSGKQPEVMRSISSAFLVPKDMTKVAEGLVPKLDLLREAAHLLSDDWSRCILRDLLEAQDATEIEAGPWLHRSAGGGDGTQSCAREISMRVKVPPHPLTPETSRASVKYTIAIRHQDGSPLPSISIDSDLHTYDVPFGGTFYLQERIQLTPAEYGVMAVKAFRVRFTEGTWMRPAIEAGSHSGQERSGEFLMSFLRKRAEGDAEVRVVELWELQRRWTLFHTEWVAPFLPHDGLKQDRWVDAEYQHHPWVLADGTAAEYDVPPVRAVKGWQPVQSWECVDPPGHCDEDGWQYAVDFYSTDQLWDDDPLLYHCRRRLWRCMFARTPARVGQ